MVEKLPNTFNEVSGVYEISHSDLCNFISEKFNIENFHLQFNCSDLDCADLFHVDAIPIVPAEKLVIKEAFLKGECEYRHIGALLDNLCHKDIIPEGTYKIIVCYHKKK